MSCNKENSQTNKRKEATWVESRFESFIEDDIKKRRCLGPSCGQIYKFTTSHNHLKGHWIKCHNSVSIQQFGDKFQLHEQKWNHYLLKWIVRSNKNYSFVENSDFKKLILSLTEGDTSKNKRLLNRHDISAKIQQKIKDLEPFLVEKLQSTVSISLTFDIWSAQSLSRSFAALTAHYLDNEMHMKSLVLEFRRIPHPHDTLHLKEFMIEAIKKFRIQQKVICITADNASVNSSALREVEEELKLSKNFGFESYQCRCFAHIINLAVKAALRPLDGALQQVRLVVSIINGSQVRQQRFTEIQQQVIEQQDGFLGSSGPTKVYSLVDEIHTRWNSTYLMLQRFLKLRAAIELAISEMDELFTIEINWTCIESLVSYLELFFELTKRVSGHNYSTIGFINASVPIVEEHIAQYLYDDALSESAKALERKLSEYSSSMRNDLAIVATALDPRIKLSSVEQYQHSSLIAKVRHYAELLKSASQTSTTDDSIESNDNRQAFHRLDKMFITEEADEVSLYFSDKRELQDSDILTWWYGNKSRYPNLAQLARVTLCVQATSVAAEEVFSKAGLIDSPRRANLSDEAFRANVLLSSWVDFINE